jgi:hypothetical protein
MPDDAAEIAVTGWICGLTGIAVDQRWVDLERIRSGAFAFATSNRKLARTRTEVERMAGAGERSIIATC